MENYFNLEAFVDNHTIKLFSYYPLNIWIFAHKVSHHYNIHIKLYVPSCKFCLKYVYKLIISKENKLYEFLIYWRIGRIKNSLIPKEKTAVWIIRKNYRYEKRHSDIKITHQLIITYDFIQITQYF